MESEVGLDGLGNLALHIILSKLGPAGAVRVSRVSNGLRLSAFEDSLWAEFCAQELHLSTPQDHHGNPAPSFKAAYQLWRKAFAMYPWPLVKRVKRCWEKLKKWLSNNFPEAEATLRRGASESDIQRLDTLLKVKLPLPTRLLYRFHDGQELKEKGAHRHCLIRSMHDSHGDELQDAMLLWLEEHCRRLENGIIKVRASAVFLPGFANLQDEAEKYFFAQSFRMSLLPEGCIINGMTFSSCQLNRRHWIIHNNEAIVSDVDGEAVIGKYPLLDPGKDEFVYESCTAAHVYLLLQVLLKVLSHLSRSVIAATSVTGWLADPKGGPFEVEVARFPLQLPDYVF
ncbi:hypothetical protein DITRI_Ditri15bG0029600 [Diplodiscus trichospermus]